MQNHPRPPPAPPTLYVGVDGVLHPDESLYKYMTGHSPWSDGHVPFEAAPLLEQALKPWPHVQIVLRWGATRNLNRAGLLARLGPHLATRVVGITLDDLTARAMRSVETLSGRLRVFGYSRDNYRRMSKAETVEAHVQWRRPLQWCVVDDEGYTWPPDVQQDKLVLTDGCVGLLSPATQDRLYTVLWGNFSEQVDQAADGRS